MHQRKFSARVASSFVLAGTSLVLATSFASALPSSVEINEASPQDDPVHVQTIEEAKKQDTLALADHFGVPYDDMEKYLVQYDKILDSAEIPTIAISDDLLGGVWIDWTPTPILAVSVLKGTDTGKLVEALKSKDVPYRIDIAKHTRKELQLAVEQFSKSNPSLISNVGIGVNEQHNNIDIDIMTSTIKDGSKTDQILNALDAAFGKYGYTTTASDNIPALENRGGRHLTSCTSGFTVTSGSLNGFLTAGHCGSTQNYMWWSDGSWHSTTFQKQEWDPSMDAQWHSVSPTVQEVVGLFHIDTSNTRPQKAYVVGNALVGSAVCRWGTRSMQPACFTITNVNYQIPGVMEDGSNRPYAAVYTRIALNSYKSCPGDSGGPWFYNNTAYGLHLGSTSGCTTNANTYAYFTPISTVLNRLGVSLVWG